MDMRKSLLAARRRTLSNVCCSINKNKRKMNDVSKAILFVVASKRRKMLKKKNTKSSVCVSYLPEELIFNILSRTCVTSLLRCKSVSKLWRSIISKPDFMNAHHVNSLNSIPSIMMITSRIDYIRDATIVYSNSPQQDSVNIPLIPPFDDLDFVSSFNGFVCVFNYVYGDIYLLNPLTGMSKKLLISPRERCVQPPPPPPLMFSAVVTSPLNNPPPPAVIDNSPPRLKHKVDVGFGFDCLSHDFKVLWIEYRGTHTTKLVDVAAVSLYSSYSDTWREIKVGIDLPSLLYHPYCPVLRSGPVVNGVLYMEGMNAIITFDLHTELFGLISYPNFIHTRKSNVLDFEGCVAVVLESVPNGSLDGKELSLWTLVAVSDEVVWNKMFTFGSGSEEIDWVFLYSGENQFFGKTRLGEMLYDYRKKQTKFVGLPSQSVLVRVFNHTESFLSLEEMSKHNLKKESHPINNNKRKRNEDLLYSLKKRRRNMLNHMSLPKHDDIHEEKKMKKKKKSSITKSKRRNDAGEGILNNLGKVKTKDEDEEKHNTAPSIIKIGDTVNLSHLLFTKNRNFLINSNQQRVEAKDLSGKLVVLYFMSLTPYYDTWGTVTKHLLDIYTKLHPKGGFEIVLVAIGDHVSHYYDGSGTTPHKCFLKEFSMMPWPAIPFSDLESRKRLKSIFSSKDTTMPCSIIIDPRGVVLQDDGNPLFLRYGAAGYPFTNDRIQFIDSEDNLLQMQQPLSIQKLLATPERDYIINNNGDQVPLHDLDHKVVGLYFCPCLDHKTCELRTTRKLKELYQELSKNTKEFEIVLIYTHGWCDHENTCGRMVEDSFLNEIKTMPWLALPFTDTNCNKKLQRIFQHPQELREPMPARLVIIGPHGKFIEPLGTQILMSYGASAYPFSLRSAVDLELEMVKKLKMEMFWDLDTVFTRKNGCQVRFSQFIGRRFIVLFQKTSCVSNVFWRELNARYFRMKGTDDEFEVIHIYRGVYANDDKDIVAHMPWFMHPPLDQGSYARKIIDRFWPGYLRNCVLLAFDRDGSVVRMKEDPELGDNMAFPFHQDGNMENEVLLHVREYIKSKLECVNDKSPFY